MSALDHLRAIGRGDAPQENGLLGNARCAWGRGELIGEESILAAFCMRPFDGSELVTVETTQGAALISDEDAFIADIYNGRVGRIWRVGREIASPHEPAIDVAFDPDMRQTRRSVFFRAEDHPQLDPAAAERVLSAAQAHIDEDRRSGQLRVRAFVVRAFGNAEASAALLAIYAMGNETSRSASFSYAIIGFGSDEAVRIVSEQTAPRPWSPRF